jgi:serine phosphatase RsbU (regulator of sigma subunit)
MSASGQYWIPKELVIRTQDGKSRRLPLNRDRLTLGRAVTNELNFPEDSALSRFHLALENHRTHWTVADLGSKNGTAVNGVRLTEPHILRASDRITAGHLALEFVDVPVTTRRTVEFVEKPSAPSATVVAKLDGLLLNPENLARTPSGLASKQTTALLRAGRELASHRPLRELFELIVDLTMDAVGGSRAVLMTLENNELVAQAARGDGFQISSLVRNRVLQEGASLLVHDIDQEASLRERHSIVSSEVKSILAAPLQTDTRIIGLLYLDSSKFAFGFSQDDLNLLTVMANIAAIRIEHARLIEVEQTERLLARDLEQAAEIQRRLLPGKAPAVPGLDLAGHNSPSRMVGGDYFDFITYPSGKVAVMVRDAAGKGMPAALMAAGLQARAQILFEGDEDLVGAVGRLNRAMAANGSPTRYVTFFIAFIDPATGQVDYVNAGHNPPLIVRRNGDLVRLAATGMVLGLFGGAPYQQATAQLNPGDLLALYSDGVTEASRGDDQEEFGEDRLAGLLRDHPFLSATELIATANRTLTSFTQGAPPADDITLLLVRRDA